MKLVTKYISTIAVTTLVVGGATYYSVNQKKVTDEKALNSQISTLQAQVDGLTKQVDSTTKKDLTNDQIFQEVAAQLNLVRSSIVYFRIFGQDRVQFSDGSGGTFAYKADSNWKIAGPRIQQAVADCNLMKEVPSKYLPPCTNGISNNAPVLYVDSTGRSINYPPAQMFSYIGQ